jgi:DnaJ-class molecular chaperone
MEYRDYYKILGVTRAATADEVKKSYRRLARKFHPDVSKEKDAEARFKEVQEAYEVLKDPEKRAAYDQLGSNWKSGEQFRPPPDWANGFEFRGGPRGGAGRQGGAGPQGSRKMATAISSRPSSEAEPQAAHSPKRGEPTDVALDGITTPESISTCRRPLRAQRGCWSSSARS